MLTFQRSTYSRYKWVPNLCFILVFLGGNARNRREQGVIIDIAVEEAILRDLYANPSISQRRLALRHGISKGSVWRILKKEGLHPYHFQR